MSHEGGRGNESRSNIVIDLKSFLLIPGVADSSTLAVCAQAVQILLEIMILTLKSYFTFKEAEGRLRRD